MCDKTIHLHIFRIKDASIHSTNDSDQIFHFSHQWIALNRLLTQQEFNLISTSMVLCLFNLIFGIFSIYILKG